MNCSPAPAPCADSTLSWFPSPVNAKISYSPCQEAPCDGVLLLWPPQLWSVSTFLNYCLTLSYFKNCGLKCTHSMKSTLLNVYVYSRVLPATGTMLYHRFYSLCATNSTHQTATPHPWSSTWQHHPPLFCKFDSFRHLYVSGTKKWKQSTCVSADG